MSKIKSFRGHMQPDTVDTINLHTNNGSIGYKIKKLQIITKNPMSGTTEAVVKVYSIPQPQTSIDAVIDFSEQTLLAVGTMLTTETQDMAIFDNIIFNQDIYVTYATQSGSDSVNYYIELEQYKLDISENTVATLKDIRNITGQ